MLSQFCESEDLEMEVSTPGGEVLPSTRCFYGVDVEVTGPVSSGRFEGAEDGGL